MKNEEILEKVINKAIKNGFIVSNLGEPLRVEVRFDDGFIGDVIFTFIGRVEVRCHQEIIFSKDFAKTFFGNNKENPTKNKYQSLKEWWYCKHDKFWEYQQHEMLNEVQEDRDPILYLEQFLNA